MLKLRRSETKPNADAMNFRAGPCWCATEAGLAPMVRGWSRYSSARWSPANRSRRWPKQGGGENIRICEEIDHTKPHHAGRWHPGSAGGAAFTSRGHLPAAAARPCSGGLVALLGHPLDQGEPLDNALLARGEVPVCQNQVSAFPLEVISHNDLYQ
jgi:hypothetical protein